MRWIRCNNCYTRAEVAKEPFTLTKCGHVYCQKCIGQAEKQCVICNAIGVATIRLQEPLESHIASYFSSLRDTLQQIVNIATFQEEQNRIVAKRYYEIEKKYTCVKQICASMEMKIVKLKDETKKIRRLEHENIQLKLALQNSQNSPYSNILSNQSQSSGASTLNQYPYKKRYQPNDSKVTFSTPLSTNSNNFSLSSHSGRQYVTSLSECNREFQIPTMNKVLRSRGTGSSVDFTPMNRNPGCLGSMNLS
ncbi:RING finger protein narya isoform X1 [Neodiprion pinetum]|uniref:RING finger protein narya isoform X1 n=1 Tax=Neodiprion lecontei TaxID=441921 RepID=A0ABM3FU12_NEOLC|nr:RING finger protein narya isoform X1 [Neodiprion pinetum]XP_046591504.1 RING finger protein narya isoform X1 [Neodiprion lecontei]XP_046612370.1 RING finger protein narya isoform X1 [Neodiprion virginianus]